MAVEVVFHVIIVGKITLKYFPTNAETNSLCFNIANFAVVSNKTLCAV